MVTHMSLTTIGAARELVDARSIQLYDNQPKTTIKSGSKTTIGKPPKATIKIDDNAQLTALVYCRIMSPKSHSCPEATIQDALHSAGLLDKAGEHAGIQGKVTAVDDNSVTVTYPTQDGPLTIIWPKGAVELPCTSSEWHRRLSEPLEAFQQRWADRRTRLSS